MSATAVAKAPPPLPSPGARPAAPAAPTLSFSVGPASVCQPRIVLTAVEGWGKTTLAAYCPSPAFLMARGETGYLTLLAKGLVPEAPRIEIDRWRDSLSVLDQLVAGALPEAETIVLDAAAGFERLCHEEVCRRDFRNEWGETGFASYQKGPEVAVSDWLLLLQRLDALWKQGKRIVILSHCAVRTFKNPLGPDFDRYVSDLNPKTWQVTHRWADAVLFGNFVAVAQKERGSAKAKGIGGQERRVYCEHNDAYDAKNRYGMPEQIEIPDDPSQSWATVNAALQGGN